MMLIVSRNIICTNVETEFMEHTSKSDITRSEKNKSLCWGVEMS